MLQERAAGCLGETSRCAQALAEQAQPDLKGPEEMLPPSLFPPGTLAPSHQLQRLFNSRFPVKSEGLLAVKYKWYVLNAA